MQFSKYSGCGNDFILFDNRSQTFPSEERTLISKLCHRQHGIGADGVILLEKSEKADFKMRIFNADGSEAEMCGNGIRCLFKFIHECGVQGHQFSIETMHTLLKIHSEENDVSVEMQDPTEVRWSLSLYPWTVHHLDTGVPHAIIFSEDLELLNLNECGSEVRHHPLFDPRGANANFAKIDDQNVVHVRTYERGVEQETLACGTGATAAALAAAKIHGLQAPISVKVRSGDTLKIDFQQKDENFSKVRLIGPAERIFTGSIAI